MRFKNLEGKSEYLLAVGLNCVTSNVKETLFQVEDKDDDIGKWNRSLPRQILGNKTDRKDVILFPNSMPPIILFTCS